MGSEPKCLGWMSPGDTVQCGACVVCRMRVQLDESRAEVARLREAIGHTSHDRGCAALRAMRLLDCDCHLAACMKALSSPSSTWLAERLKSERATERERCAKVAEDGFGDVEDRRDNAAAIRALGDE